MSHPKKFAGVIVAALTLGAGVWAWSQTSGDDGPARAAEGPVVQVFKTAACGCCADWVAYMRDEGFRVEAEDLGSSELVAAKHDRGVPSDLFACHTAVVGGYVVEGHVPAGDVRRLLEEAPDVAGIAVPEMPIGSPGMEMGDREEPYDVVAFDGEGGRSVFASY